MAVVYHSMIPAENALFEKEMIPVVRKRTMQALKQVINMRRASLVQLVFWHQEKK